MRDAGYDREQARDDGGRFRRGEGQGSYLVPAFGDDALDRLQAFKVSSHEERQLEILFYEHKRLMRWKTKSDMLRDMCYLGKQRVMEAIANPDPELLEMYQQDEIMMAMAKSVNRHEHAEQMMSTTADSIQRLKERRNYGAIRRHLTGLLDVCKKTKDPVLREALMEAFENRFGQQWKDLKKGTIPGIDH